MKARTIKDFGQILMLAKMNVQENRIYQQEVKGK
jgi:hypothetical protein